MRLTSWAFEPVRRRDGFRKFAKTAVGFLKAVAQSLTAAGIDLGKLLEATNRKGMNSAVFRCSFLLTPPKCSTRKLPP